MTDLNVPDGMVLACRTCGWRPGEDLPIGMIQAHMQTEHGTDEVVLDLIVVCPRGGDAMDFERTDGSYDVFACPKCRRVRKIRRAEAAS